MQHLQHICSEIVNAEAFQSHGETILYVEDLTGKQIEYCPGCGELIAEGMLFPLDIFPEVYAEMAERELVEV